MDNLKRVLMQTPNVNEERLATLKELFPDLFTLEGTLNPEEIQKLIDPELVKETERFEFKWFGKSHAKRTAFTPSNATLVYDEQRSVNPHYADGNIIIEGENLEVMKCLLSAYREKIKCMYIDPPYNTGNDFIYSDTWDESKEEYWEHIGVTKNGIRIEANPESNGRYHSKWLNMMYPRLLLARQLLRHDGVMFISIDDHESEHLRKLCDEVFGEENFLGTVVWKKKHAYGRGHTFIIPQTEYILCYAHHADEVDSFGTMYSEKKIKEFKYEDERGKYRLLRLWFTAPRGAYLRPTLQYQLYTPDGKRVDSVTGQWLWSQERMQREIANNNVVFVEQNDGSIRAFKKDHLASHEAERPSSFYDKVTTDDATKEFNALLPEVQESMFTKPSQLIFDLISWVTFLEPHEEHIICDFFAGSGTTAQAVSQLNQSDGGNRKCILVQMPELIDEQSEAYKAGYRKISDIAIERNKRVIEKIEKETQEKLFDDDKRTCKTGFKAYTLAKSNFPRVSFQPDPDKTGEENIELLKTYIQEKEAAFMSLFNAKDIFDEVLLKNGFMLNYTLETIADFTKNKVHKVSDTYKEGLLCLDMSLAEETISTLETYKEHIFICLERALDTTKKWNLKHLLGDKLIAF